jgi:hypothetical protein
MRSHPTRRKLRAATPTTFHPRSRRPSTLNLQDPLSSLDVAGGCRPLRAYGEVRAHSASGELSTATPTTFHPRSSWAANEIEGGVLLKLPYANLTPALATALRETITAERQNRVVVLLKGNVLAAAQTDGHMNGCQPYRARHRTASAWTRNSSTIPFYGSFGAEACISLALAVLYCAGTTAFV